MEGVLLVVCVNIIQTIHVFKDLLQISVRVIQVQLEKSAVSKTEIYNKETFEEGIHLHVLQTLTRNT